MKPWALENCVLEAHPNNPKLREIDVPIKNRQRVVKELDSYVTL